MIAAMLWVAAWFFMVGALWRWSLREEEE
jgi:hypothetical protein